MKIFLTKKRNEKGFIALVTILVITAVALVLATSANLLGLGELQMSFNEAQSFKALDAANSCLDEALLRLKRNSDFSSGGLNVDSDSCTINIAQSGNNRIITAEGVAGDAVKKIETEVDISSSPFTLNYYKEIP